MAEILATQVHVLLDNGTDTRCLGSKGFRVSYLEDCNFTNSCKLKIIKTCDLSITNYILIVIKIVIGKLGTISKGLVMRLEVLKIRGPFRLQHYYDQPEYLEESRRLAVTHTPL